MTEHEAAILEAAKSRLDGYPEATLLAEPSTLARRPGDRRSEVGLRLALEALAAHRRGDWHRFYAMGHELLLIERQRGSRGKRPGGGDALAERIAAYVEELPEASSEEIVTGITKAAESGLDHVLAEFDGRKLTYDQGGRLRDLSLEALLRRVQRARSNALRLNPKH